VSHQDQIRAIAVCTGFLLINQGVGGRSRAGVGRTKEEGENRGRFFVVNGGSEHMSCFFRTIEQSILFSGHREHFRAMNGVSQACYCIYFGGFWRKQYVINVHQFGEYFLPGYFMIFYVFGLG